MASRRQQTKRGKQKLILAVGVTALIIFDRFDRRTYDFFEKIFSVKGGN